LALRGVPEHPKFAALKAKLSLSKFEGMGLLETLWHFTGRYAPRGDIGRFPDEQIEAWLEWKAKPGAAIAALIDTGWIDHHPKYRLVIHDWHEHADNTTKKQVSRRAKTQLDKGLSVDWVFVGLEGLPLRMSGHRPDMSSTNGNVSRPPAPAPAPAPAPEPNTPSTTSRGKRAAEKRGTQAPEVPGGEEVANPTPASRNGHPLASEASRIADVPKNEAGRLLEPKPNGLQLSGGGSKRPHRVASSDARFVDFRDHLKAYYGAVNRQSAGSTPWGKVEDRALSDRLQAEPSLTLDDLAVRLGHLVTAVRICSEKPRMRKGEHRGNVGPRDPLAAVIRRLPEYADGPVDAFGEKL
jgi:hypothetical protein